jgi:hypothetical protein
VDEGELIGAPGDVAESQYAGIEAYAARYILYLSKADLHDIFYNGVDAFANNEKFIA